MILEIPDRVLLHMREMPPQKIDKSKPSRRKYNLHLWIGRMSHVAIFMTYRAIAKRAEEMGWIKFDPETETWKGVDYHGD